MYLPLFFNRFHPSCDHTPNDFERDLMRRLGESRYGDRYNAESGLIDEASPVDCLRQIVNVKRVTAMPRIAKDELVPIR